MKKLLIIFLLLAVAGTIFFFFAPNYFNKSTKTTKYTIGILQTASHPALDAAREGFMHTMQNKLHSDISFIVQNAEGSIAHAHAIAQRFQSNKKIDGFFAIATPAAQALAAVEKNRFITLAAVTDPHALGIIKENSNITGSTDMIDVPGQIKMLTTLIPTAKTVALLYNNAEINSKTVAEKMIAELNKSGISTLKICISCEADLGTALDSALKNADVLLAPTDNLVASAISFIAKRALQAKKPLIVSDNLLIKYGPLAARGVDYYKSGEQAGAIAAELLATKKKPYQIPFVQALSNTVYINKNTANTLGISTPEIKDILYV